MNTLKTLLLSVLLPFSIANAFAQWTDVSPALTIALRDIYCPSPDTCYATGFNLANTTRVIRTEDGGQTWFIAESGIPPNIDNASVFCTNNNTCFVGGDNVIYKTIDGGNSWYLVNSPFGFGSIGYIFFVNDSIGYATGGGDYLKTTDAGENWVWQSILVLPATAITSIYMLNNNLGYAVGSSFSGGDIVEIAKTTDGGTNWADIGPSYPPNTFLPMAMYCINDTTCYIVGCCELLVKTTDGGATWDTITLDSNAWPYFDIDCVGDTCYIVGGGPYARVLKSADGVNWILDTAGITLSAQVDRLSFPSPNVGYIGWNGVNGIFKKDISVGMLEAGNKNISFLLYPNPFNEYTTLHFQNADIGLINGSELSVYNMLGSEVKKIKINNRKTIITRENLNSGIYLYAVHSSNKTIARGKLIIE